jgi:hypothetical protein
VTMHICESCWDAKNEMVAKHRCWARIVETISCDCPCRERSHSDLNTIDLDHDRGTSFLTSRFGEEE